MKLCRFLLAIAVLALSLHAADEHSVTVKSISVENGTVTVHADLQGKPNELICQIGLPSCSQPQPGEYRMQPATADEDIYQDCTNIVLLKASGAQKEKIGVYCWPNSGDYYLASPSNVRVETIPAVVPDTALEGASVTGPALLETTVCDLVKRSNHFDKAKVRVKAVVMSDLIEHTLLVDNDCPARGISLWIPHELDDSTDVRALRSELRSQWAIKPSNSQISAVFDGTFVREHRKLYLKVLRIGHVDVAPNGR